MKKVLNFFSRPDEELKAPRTTYVSREPTLNRQSADTVRNSFPGVSQNMRPDMHSAQAEKRPAPAPKNELIPTDYAGIVEFFQRKVRNRKSPYNGLVDAADRLKDIIPNEASRLKAVLAISSEKWPLETLSLAISTHISDIEHARIKAKEDTQLQASERTIGLQKQADELNEKNEKIQSEIRALHESIQKLEASLNTNKSTLETLNAQIQLAEVNASSISFVDQAAENLKNDLLAKKVILGLP